MGITLTLEKEQAVSLKRILSCEVRECLQREKEAAYLLRIRPECRVDPSLWGMLAEEAKNLYEYIEEAAECKK